MSASYDQDRQVYMGIVGIQSRCDQFSQGMEIGQWVRESEKVWSKQRVFPKRVKKEKEIRQLDIEEQGEDRKIGRQEDRKGKQERRARKKKKKEYDR